MTLLISFFLLSIIISFLCSVWEAVLLSVNPSYIKRMEQENPATGKLLDTLKKDIDKPLSAILTLNTIAHTVGAIGVGAQAGKLFGSNEISMFGFSLTYESIIATIMTMGILFLSEIIPKTIGANNWDSLAPITAKSLNFLMILLKPFVWLSNQLTKLLKKDKKRSIFSKQDFAAMAEVVSESGEIKSEDFNLIKNVLQFDELQAKDVMTPSNVMVIADESQTMFDFYNEHRPFIFSRIPIYEGSKEHVAGIILKDELLQHIIENKGKSLLSSIKREVITLRANTPLRKAFETLNQKNGHLAIVVDEYGTLVGLVTLEDIIETLFGFEIVDETDTVSDLQKYARQKWEERAKKLGLIE